MKKEKEEQQKTVDWYGSQHYYRVWEDINRLLVQSIQLGNFEQARRSLGLLKVWVSNWIKPSELTMAVEKLEEVKKQLREYRTLRGKDISMRGYRAEQLERLEQSIEDVYQILHAASSHMLLPGGSEELAEFNEDDFFEGSG